MKAHYLLLYHLFFYLVLFEACIIGTETNLQLRTWQPLGLHDKLVNDLMLDGEYLYACAGKDGLFRLDLNESNNEWEYLGLADSTSPRDNGYRVTSVYIDKSNNVIFTGIFTPQTTGIGIFRSEDNGETWVPSDSGIKTQNFPFSTQVYSINGISSPKSVILVGMSATIFRSINCGISWNLVWGNPDAAGLGVNAIEFNISEPNEVWAGGETSRFAPFLLHSIDFGENWELIYPLFSLGPYSDNAIYDIAIDPENKGTIYLGMLGVIMKTVDYGQTWQKILGAEDGIYSNWWCLEVNPNNNKEILATGARLYTTTNGGDSWEKFSPPNEHTALYNLVVDWDKRLLYVSSSSPENGIYKLNF